MSDYVASQSRDSYYNADARVPSRLWAAEKALHDLSEIGLIEFFEGPGPNPTVHSGYASGKIWLRQNPGVQPQQGQFRVWTGDSPVSSEANWSELTAARFFQLVTGGITNTIFPIATQPEAEAGVATTSLMNPLRTKQAIEAVRWTRGPGIVRSPQDIAKNGWALFDFIDPTKHSAIRAATDVTDLTIPIQSALDSGEELKAGRGRYYISGVDVPTKTRLWGEGKEKVSFILANGSNRSAFKLPLTDVAVGDFEQPVLEGFFLNANGNAQSGTSYGIELPNAGFSLATSYGSAVTMNNVQVESGRSGNLFSGTNRGAGFLNDCIFRYALTDVVTLNGYDWRIKGGDIGGSGIGGSATGNCLTLASGGALTLLGVNIFSAPQIGIAVSALVNSFVDVIGCSLDLHGREGLSASYGTGQRIGIIGGRIGSNSKEGSGLYSHVRFSANNTAHAIIGTVFERGGSPAKHIVEFQGTCAPILFNAVYPVGGSAPYDATLTNDLTRLKFAGTGDEGWVGTQSDGSISMGVGTAETFKAGATEMLILKALRMQGATPRVWLQETDAAANSGRHMIDIEAGELRGFLSNDAESSLFKWLSLTRSGIAVGRLKFDVTGGKLAFAGLPTSSAGLSSGDVWLNANVLTIVP